MENDWMIERLQAQNFQRHEKLRVKFGPKTTTIVGPSDAGKSSVMRAIRWLAFNRPLSDSFIRRGQDSCSVKLWVDGRKVERRKSKGKNLYLIDGQELTAFGTDVPEQVSRLLNLTPDNFQGQHDPPFWFSLTAGEVAKRLNKIVDLDVIDKSAGWLASRLRKARTELEVIEERRVEAKAEAEFLSYVDDLQFDYRRLKKQADKADAAVEHREDLARSLESARKRGQDARSRRSAAKAGNQALALGDAAGAVSRRLRGLADAVAKAKASRSQAEQQIPDLSALEDAYNRVEETGEDRRRLSNLLYGIRKAKDRAENTEWEYKDAEREMTERTEGVCPICGGELG